MTPASTEKVDFSKREQKHNKITINNRITKKTDSTHKKNQRIDFLSFFVFIVFVS
jgi:hypothetical protein